MTPSTVKPENMLPCYELNVLGIVRVTNAFLPLLEQSPAASIVNVSSNRGSLTMLACDLSALATQQQAHIQVLCAMQARAAGRGHWLGSAIHLL